MSIQCEEIVHRKETITELAKVVTHNNDMRDEVSGIQQHRRLII